MLCYIICRTGLKPFVPRAYYRLFKYIKSVTEKSIELGLAPPKTEHDNIYLNMHRTNILKLTRLYNMSRK